MRGMRPPTHAAPQALSSPSSGASPLPAAQVNFDNARFRDYILRADALARNLKAELAAAGVAPVPPAKRVPWCVRKLAAQGAHAVPWCRRATCCSKGMRSAFNILCYSPCHPLSS
jgi:hypothetical protein